MILTAGGASVVAQNALLSDAENGKFTISSKQALASLASQSGKTVAWIGAPPAGDVEISRASRTLAEIVGALADDWNVAVMVTPDAIFFHAPKTFDHVRPAHFDPLLPQINSVELLNRLPRSALARFPLGLTSVPPPHVPKSLAEALPLSVLEKESPGFEKELRELLKRAGTRLSGEKKIGGETTPYKVRLDEAPAEQIFVRLYSTGQVWCEVGKDHAGFLFPVSLST